MLTKNYQISLAICLLRPQLNQKIFTSNGGVIVWCLGGTDLSPSLRMWAARDEAEADHREELNRLHVLNLFATEGWREWKENVPFVGKWQGCRDVGRTPLKLTPDLCTGTALA